MPVNMTSQWLERMKLPSQGRVEHFDEKVAGLVLRATSTGNKSWYLMYREKGDLKRQRRLLGSYPQMTLATARETAQTILLSIKKGEELEEKKPSDRHTPYFKDLAEQYIEKYAKIKKKSWAADEWLLKKELLPVLGTKKAKTIKRRDVIELVTSIHDRGAPVQANRTLALLRKIYNWAIERDILEVNPCFRVKAPGTENERDRVLIEPEIRAVWAALEAEDLVIGTMFKLRLMTAQRGGEVESMRWADIDADWWTIPKERAKNGLAHRVPLTSTVLELLSKLRAKTGKQEWLFPSPKRGCGHIANVQKAAQRIQDACGVPDLVMHDLRRTAASYMTRNGIHRSIVSKVLNHVEPGVTRVYDRHSYDPEKRQALTTWEAVLMRILSEGDGTPTPGQGVAENSEK